MKARGMRIVALTQNSPFFVSNAHPDAERVLSKRVSDCWAFCTIKALRDHLKADEMLASFYLQAFEDGRRAAFLTHPAGMPPEGR